MGDSAAVDEQAASLQTSQLLTKDKQTPKITPEQTSHLLELVQEGESIRDAAKAVGIGQWTAYRVMERYESALDGVRNLMSLRAHKRLEEWEQACETAAKRKGNHAPMRDWLLHAGVIEPLQADTSTSVRIAICIGTPDKPMAVERPVVLEGELLGGKLGGDSDP